MVADVIGDERRDEEVAVVVAFMLAQIERVAGFVARGAQQLWLQLLLEEAVREALVDQDLEVCGFLTRTVTVTRATGSNAPVAGPRLRAPSNPVPNMLSASGSRPQALPVTRTPTWLGNVLVGG